MGITFTVIIPLYNKENEVRAAMESVAAQTLRPKEIIVVDDGSTDGGAAIVEEFDLPGLRLIRQDNAGVSAARNRAIGEATGDYIAMLDADDSWHPRYLECVAHMTEKYPGCGMYITGMNIIKKDKSYEADQPVKEGIIEDYFMEANDKFMGVPSCVTVPRVVFEKLGGFPDGMRLGEDQYLWIQIVDGGYKACFSPEKLCNYYVSATNRSQAIYKSEKTRYSFMDFYREGDFYRNELLARTEINKGIVISVKGGTREAKRIEKQYAYTALHKRALCRLQALNRVPATMRRYLDTMYKSLAWIMVRKGY